MNRVRRVAVAALLVMVSAATAHDLHQSTGGAEYNPDTKRLEVSLTFFADDLELALIRFSERMISLREAETEKADAVIQAYLNQTFVLTEADGAKAAFSWVGRELEKAGSPLGEERVTLYFELSLPSGLQGHTLTHSALHSCFEDQMNLLSLKVAGMKMELRFTKAQPSKALSTEQPASIHAGPK